MEEKKVKAYIVLQPSAEDEARLLKKIIRKEEKESSNSIESQCQFIKCLLDCRYSKIYDTFSEEVRRMFDANLYVMVYEIFGMEISPARLYEGFQKKR